MSNSMSLTTLRKNSVSKRMLLSYGAIQSLEKLLDLLHQDGMMRRCDVVHADERTAVATAPPERNINR